uniref:Uncharacterized protein n=1 Tax=Tetradesmus obliquus TaxID=3088 RepID=A0A383VYP9_TETOB|eukprot:jgi/Sobl393_1/19773/SZX70050.1
MPNSHEDAPATDGSAMQRMVASSIKRISNDSPTALQELADIVDEWGSSFDFITTAAAITKAANLRRVQPAGVKPLLDTLAGTWDGVLEFAGPQALANVLWACGKLRCTNAHLWSSTWAAAAEQIQHSPQSFEGINFANIVHGLATGAAANKGQCCPGQHAAGYGTASDAGGSRAPRLFYLFVGGERAAAALQLAATSGAAVWRRLLGEAPLQRAADKGSVQAVANLVMTLARLSAPPAAAAAAGAAGAATAAAAGGAAGAATAAVASVPLLSQELAQQCAQELLQGKTAQQLENWPPQAVSNSLWACGRLGLREASFVNRAAAAAPVWLRDTNRADVVQIATACRLLQYSENQLMEQVVQRTAQLLSQLRGKGSDTIQSIGLTAVVAHAVAALDMQQLAGEVRQLVVKTGVTHSFELKAANAGLLWTVHQWLVQQQLLDGQGLAGLLSPQQLAAGKAAAAAHQAQQEQ